MTTALAFDLFLDEYDVIEEVKLLNHISNELKSKGKTTPRLSVVKNENREDVKFNTQSLFFRNEISSNGLSFDSNVKFENESSKIENLNSEQIRKEMMKGYMGLLSN